MSGPPTTTNEIRSFRTRIIFLSVFIRVHPRPIFIDDFTNDAPPPRMKILGIHRRRIVLSVFIRVHPRPICPS